MSDENEIEKEFTDHLKDSDLQESTKKVLEGLTDREAKVLRMRFGIDMNSNHSLEEVSKQFDVTRQRILEIEERALRKFRNRNDDDPNDSGPASVRAL